MLNTKAVDIYYLRNCYISIPKHIGVTMRKTWGFPLSYVDTFIFLKNKLCSNRAKSYNLCKKNTILQWCNVYLLKESRPPEVFLGKRVLEICSKFTKEHPCRSVISVKLQSNFIEITLWHGPSPVNLLHVFRTPFYKYI